MPLSYHLAKCVQEERNISGFEVAALWQHLFTVSGSLSVTFPAARILKGGFPEEEDRQSLCYLV